MRRFASPVYPIFSFNRRGYLTHSQLIHKMKILGYSKDENVKNGDDGLCHGIACLAAYAHLTDQYRNFDQKIEEISQLSETTNIRRLDSSMTLFLDAIALAQSPEEYRLHWKKINPNSPGLQFQQTQPVLQYFASREKKEKIHRGAIFSGIYTIDELTHYFSLLRQAYHHSPHPFALLLHSLNHIISVHIDKKTSRWYLIDANKLPQQIFHTDQPMALAVNQALSYTPNALTLLGTSAFTLKKYQRQSQQFWSYIQCNALWKQLHNVDQKCHWIDPEENAWIHIAALKGLAHDIKKLLKAGANPNKLNQEEESPLELACMLKHYAVIKLLLSHKAFVNLGEPSPLYLAVINNDVMTTKLLLDHGALPDINSQYSPLRLAVDHGNIALVKMLLEHGANPNQGSPALLIQAIKKGDDEIASLLKKHGAQTGSQLFFKTSSILNSNNTRTPSMRNKRLW